jgi:hypothetical protein
MKMSLSKDEASPLLLPIEFYRSTAVGESLILSLNKLLESGEISHNAALTIIKVFDKQVPYILRESLILEKGCTPLKLEVSSCLIFFGVRIHEYVSEKVIVYN